MSAANIPGDTQKPIQAAVIGWPIKHSRSPLIHNTWLNQLGIAARYEKYAVDPADVTDFLRSMPERGLLGCNVTIPHKTIAYETADNCHPDAVAVGAANTIWFEGNKMCATNTDIYGFITHLDASAPQWRKADRPVTLLGAGGAARAIVYGFLQSGVTEIRIVNRTRAAADELTNIFGPKIRAVDWHEMQSALTDCGVLVNTTSLGMEGGPALEIDLSPMPDGSTVNDIVYVPLETPLLAAARARGLVAVDGLGMLLHQAVPSFERWFHVRPQVTPMLRDSVIADLKAHP
ncbi:MAG: shikimate dehydrogenase [Hyphomicrobiaceae bacterium]|nr:shikimate dehydrogenase [Hyphomicrobiaceae bacterium]